MHTKLSCIDISLRSHNKRNERERKERQERQKRKERQERKVKEGEAGALNIAALTMVIWWKKCNMSKPEIGNVRIQCFKILCSQKFIRSKTSSILDD